MTVTPIGILRMRSHILRPRKQRQRRPTGNGSGNAGKMKTSRIRRSSSSRVRFDVTFECKLRSSERRRSGGRLRATAAAAAVGASTVTHRTRGDKRAIRMTTRATAAAQ